jgi:hypothetical protein
MKQEVAVFIQRSVRHLFSAGIILAMVLILLSGAACIVVQAPPAQTPAASGQPAVQQVLPQTPSTPAATPAAQQVAPTNYPTQSYQPPATTRHTGGRILVWSEHPYIGPWGELDIDARGVTAGGIVTLTIYAPDNKVAVQLQRFGEWDREADWDLHASNWAPGQYQAVVKDVSSGQEGETVITVGAGSQYYYDD